MRKKQVLFVQGGGEGAHEADAKLAASLGSQLGPDYDVRYPMMTNEAAPNFAAWTARISKEAAEMGGGTILVGHSLGASILLKFFVEKERQLTFGGVFLIAAPFCGSAAGWQWEEAELPKDASARLSDAVPIFLYHSRDDDEVPYGHVDLYARELPRAVVRRLAGRNHQLNDDLSAVAADIRGLAGQ